MIDTLYARRVIGEEEPDPKPGEESLIYGSPCCELLLDKSYNYFLVTIFTINRRSVVSGEVLERVRQNINQNRVLLPLCPVQFIIILGITARLREPRK